MWQLRQVAPYLRRKRGVAHVYSTGLESVMHEVRAISPRKTPPTRILFSAIDVILNLLILLRSCMDDQTFDGLRFIRQYLTWIGR